MQTVSCIAHRGASGIAPENTLLALWTAYKSYADIIEMDVQVTKDEKLVLFHDKDLKRITGEETRIADHTLDDLLRKDVGRWKGPQFRNTKIAEFASAVQELPSNASFIIEVKPQKVDLENNFNLERLILKELDSSNIRLGNGYISVRSEESYIWLKEYTTKYPVGLMQKTRTPEEYYEVVKKHGIKFAQVRRNNDKMHIEALKKLGCKVMMFYADTPDEWGQIISMGVDGILTNYPSLLSGYLSMYNKSVKKT